MSAIDEIVTANRAASVPAGAAKKPSRQLAILTCMDCRIDLFGALGLSLGQAHILRNAGGLVTDDVLRSIALSQHDLGTTAVAVVMHTDCGMTGFDDAAFRARLAGESGETPGWDVPGFTDVRAAARSGVEHLRNCPWLAHRDEVRGFVYDTVTTRLSEVTQRNA